MRYLATLTAFALLTLPAWSSAQTLTQDGQHIVPDTTGATLIVSLAQHLLFIADGDVVRYYPIGVGTRAWPTPVGRFTVLAKEANPTWDVPVSIQEEMRREGKPVLKSVPPGPLNPLGSHFIRLSFNNIGIHGTIAPASVGHYATHGCIRMLAADVAALYADVSPGQTGVSVYQPVLSATVGGRVYIEAHADGYGRARSPLAQVKRDLALRTDLPPVDWTMVEDVIRRRDGRAFDVTRRD